MLGYAVLLLLGSIAVSEANKCDIGLVKGVASTDINLAFNENEGHFWLTCVGNKTLLGLKFNKTIYARLICNDRGWHGTYKNGYTLLADSSSEIQVSCEQYCVATGEGINTRIAPYQDRHTWKWQVLQVYCPGTKQLIYKGEPLVYDLAQCVISDGWSELLDRRGEEREDIDDMHYKLKQSFYAREFTPLEFECREVATPTCLYTVVNGMGSNSIYRTADLHMEVDSNMVTTLTCPKPLYRKSIVKLRAKLTGHSLSGKDLFYLKSLSCDKEGGWKATDFDGNTEAYVIGKAYGKMEVYCETHCGFKDEKYTIDSKKMISGDGREYVNVTCRDPNHDMYRNWEKINSTHATTTAYCEPEDWEWRKPGRSSEWKITLSDNIRKTLYWDKEYDPEPIFICSKKSIPCAFTGFYEKAEKWSNGVRVTCGERSIKMGINDYPYASDEYDAIECDEETGWNGIRRFTDRDHTNRTMVKIADASQFMYSACMRN